MLMIVPPLLPYSAEYPLLISLNSWMPSTDGL